MRVRRLLVSVALAALGGCAFPHEFSAPPRSLPPLSVDVAASEVTSEIGGANSHREEIARFLEEISEENTLRGMPRKPARFRAVVRGDSRWGKLAGSFFYCGIYIGLVTDCGYVDVDRTVELEIEIDGKRYAGSGWSSRGASTWFNASGYHSLKEATEIAVRRSIEAGAYRAPTASIESSQP